MSLGMKLSWGRQSDNSGNSSAGASSSIPKSARGTPSPRWEDKLKDEAFRKMSLAELSKATGNFDKANLLGSGGFGEVYKGVGPNGQAWAVKKARPGVISGTGTSQGLKDFEREVVTMSQMAHKHLVRLLGYCMDKNEHIVVYELMEKGSLATALHGSSAAQPKSSPSASSSPASTEATKKNSLANFSGRLLNGFKSSKGSGKSTDDHAGDTSSEDFDVLGPNAVLGANGTPEVEKQAKGGRGGTTTLCSLNFLQRVEIATGTAEALHYLHSGLDAPVVHRDIKPDNILLDGAFRPKVADFGLVKLMKGSATVPDVMIAESFRVTGTRGYLDPDYMEGGKASPAVDVYSFGVVMLELLTGRKPAVRRREDLAAMFSGSHVITSRTANAEEPRTGSSMDSLDLSKGNSTESLDRETARGQQVPLRHWVDQVVRTHKDLKAILDPKMELELGTSSRRRKLRPGEEAEGQNAVEDSAAFQRSKEEAVQSAIKVFLKLALKCTDKTKLRPTMSEVATQLQEVRRSLRAARERPQIAS